MATTIDTANRISGIAANYYYVKDFNRALNFYTTALGLEPTMQHAPMFAEFTFPGGETFGIYASEQWQPGNGVMFAVSNLHETVAAFKAKGVKIMDHIEDLPNCYMAFAEDTEGNNFIIHQTK